ncbi:FAD-binding and (Fe-S)-binding domain-containing protein [Gloeobacter kilaueensis]|uniref:D-lactate dehydrogenase (Cytochrome) n=1 Tax=Gloeobacter kilaueensis (strain ATCC BAA-2537 / CCAP 1431/1 / ULC 316 / JS1) TaxID=1183438 RepID=U5QLV3_GLOK1|nr:FAD-binding and (Fe-S)-binding domain-containing protein [Gloeobacter kilaueensis]AGY59886.1 D-lactate dehydrogenase (cytochrome) [Gloeobacter kilaueensis JS1]
MQSFVEDLRRQIEGEVRFGEFDRVLYSTDASFYRIKPIGVVIPRTEADVVATVEQTRRAKLPVLARGGGTSVSGQAVGEAVVLDFSKYMHRVLELNLEEGWAWVEPGLVQDAFKKQLRPYALQFGPETATASRATLGGMAANNSAGARSVVYGKAIDHILACRAVLADGSLVTFGSVSEAERRQKAEGSSLEAQLYRQIPRIVERHKEAILERYPRVLRRVSGYNLDALVSEFADLSPMADPDRRFNLAKLLVGSEGTLGVLTAIKVRLIPLPAATALGVVHFDNLNAAVDAVSPILELGPSAVELVDHQILGPAMRSRQFQDRVGFVQGDPAALLIVEFQGEKQQELAGRLEALRQRLGRERLGYALTDVFGEQEQAEVWNLRKAGLGMLMSVRDERKPVAFVEDPAVPVERMPEFVRAFQKIVAEHGVRAGYYGHASVGCLHIRPALNLKDTADIERMNAIFAQVSDLTRELGGSMSGEHGDGLARSWLNEKMFGGELYGAFQQVKRAFDFENRLNPGKVVDAPPPDRNLRYGPDYRTVEPATTFDFSREFGIARAVEMCNGNGNCRKQDVGTMCPSYQGTRDEMHSTRGRANALRAVLAGQAGAETFTGRGLYEVMDLCLSCKSCQTECPSSINMAKLKAEFLSHYHREHGTPLRDRVIGNIALVNRIGSATAPFSNWLLHSGLGTVGKRMLGFAPAREFPAFASQPFSRWFRRHRPWSGTSRGKVVLFHDTYMEYNDPTIGMAATELLERLGYEVILPERRCCGRPMISKGLLKEAQVNARFNVEQLTPYAQAGIPVVGCEPSCILTLRDEYLDLVPGGAAKDVASHSQTIDEFLHDRLRAGELALPFKSDRPPALVHGHCHQKAITGTRPTLEVLKLAYDVREIASGCCGMAGSFGYEREHYDLSLTIGSQRLFPAIEQATAQTVLIADGISCRQQIQHGTRRTAQHLVQALAAALR